MSELFYFLGGFITASGLAICIELKKRKGC